MTSTTDDRNLGDTDLSAVCHEILMLDSSGRRFAQVLRETFDQLYDGQRTGRFRWDQLFKTEKTHFGTLVEINIQREFGFKDGSELDFEIAGHEVDCKYSFREGGWMLPPECWGKLAMVICANDEKSEWSLGVVRVKPEYLRKGLNRDGKSGLNQNGREAITWLFRHSDMPSNVLLGLSAVALESIFSKRSGQSRLDELFRQVTGKRIHRNTIATVAQQQDFMKRLRENGGSRSNLREEGFLILSGDYHIQRNIAAALALPVPDLGEVVSVKVVKTTASDKGAVLIGQSFWRKATFGEVTHDIAPIVPRS